jgi:hypothetical protein
MPKYQSFLFSVKSFFVLVLIVRTVPVATEYTSSRVAPASSKTTFPWNLAFAQFLRSIPIPPVTLYCC